MQTHHWNLYVDESGDFDAPDGRCAVAALVTRSPHNPRIETRLRRHLRHAFPFSSYPYHASHLNLPAYHALCYHLHQSRVSDQDRTDQARAHLEPLARQLAASFPELNEQSTYEDILRADQTLRHRHRAAYQQAAQEVELAQEYMFNLLQGLSQDAFLCGARFGGGATTTDPITALVEDAYVTLLMTLIQRIISLHADFPRSRLVLTLHILTRRVTYPTGTQLLGPTALRRIALRARESVGIPEDFQPELHIEIPHEGPLHWNAATPARLVLADWLANRLRSLQGVSWSDFARNCLHTTGLGVEFQHPTRPFLLPTVAASGDTQFRLRAAWAGTPPEPRPGSWRIEQADRFTPFISALYARSAR